MYAIGLQSLGQYLAIRTGIAHSRENGVQDDPARGPVVGMIQIGRIFRLLVGIWSKNVFGRIVGKDNAWTVLANETNDSLAGGFAVSKMSIGETQKLERLNSIYLAGHTLLLFACEHQIGIYQAGHLAALSPIGHNYPGNLLALPGPECTGSTCSKILCTPPTIPSQKSPVQKLRLPLAP